MGVCYYPEHWSEALWEDDFRRMKEMNITVIRMAEFAWSIFEPEEDQFDFSFFQKALDLAHQYGLSVILGTPTATPPAWLTSKYPEVLNANKDGVLYQHGMRRHTNYSGPIFRQQCEKIVRNMVIAYKDHPALIGWQIDNEFNCHMDVFYAEADHVAFREWLKNRYESLENLNQAWGTVFGVRPIPTGRKFTLPEIWSANRPILIWHWMRRDLSQPIRFLLPSFRWTLFANWTLNIGSQQMVRLDIWIIMK